MAVEITRSRYNIRGSAAGIANPIVYFGPTLDMTAGTSPITSTNTLKVWRYNESTGAKESYVPGGGSNDFTSLDAGTLGLGRGYVIIAKANFLLPSCNPSA